ncbi:putative signal peptide protein [Puccinia sorghi]|uniref:Putative signal peptide protein n=1 Tax=Puccinia sorghi TaxID=27349 RepID=A0A0L6V2A1_9BASI|nr:putative signal peptide protein [Puccinia sorghi]
MQHAPAKLPFKLHMFAYVEFLAQSLCIKAWLNHFWSMVGVKTEASWDFLNVNCRHLSKFFLQFPNFTSSPLLHNLSFHFNSLFQPHFMNFVGQNSCKEELVKCVFRCLQNNISNILRNWQFKSLEKSTSDQFQINYEDLNCFCDNPLWFTSLEDDFRNSELYIKIIWNYPSDVFYKIGIVIDEFRKVNLVIALGFVRDDLVKNKMPLDEHWLKSWWRERKRKTDVFSHMLNRRTRNLTCLRNVASYVPLHHQDDFGRSKKNAHSKDRRSFESIFYPMNFFFLSNDSPCDLDTGGTNYLFYQYNAFRDTSNFFMLLLMSTFRIISEGFQKKNDLWHFPGSVANGPLVTAVQQNPAPAQPTPVSTPIPNSIKLAKPQSFDGHHHQVFCCPDWPLSTPEPCDSIRFKCLIITSFARFHPNFPSLAVIFTLVLSYCIFPVTLKVKQLNPKNKRPKYKLPIYFIHNISPGCAYNKPVDIVTSCHNTALIMTLHCTDPSDR